MIKVVEFSSHLTFGRASKQFEDYLNEKCIKREQIISITSNQAKNDFTGDTIMLVYEE